MNSIKLLVSSFESLYPANDDGAFEQPSADKSRLQPSDVSIPAIAEEDEDEDEDEEYNEEEDEEEEEDEDEDEDEYIEDEDNISSNDASDSNESLRKRSGSSGSPSRPKGLRRRSKKTSTSAKNHPDKQETHEVDLLGNQTLLQDDSPVTQALPHDYDEKIAAKKQQQQQLLLQQFVQKVVYVILFVPNYAIIKPLLFLWYLVTYPFAYFFNITNDDDEGLLNNIDRLFELSAEDKIELLKHENLLSNNFKSPTESSKYIIPPPQRLYPLSRRPDKPRKKKTLILDLDETLIHSLSRGSPRSYSNSASSQLIEISLHNISTLYYVHKRPYCDHFLLEVSRWYDLQVFTASVKEYADPIIDWLESEVLAQIDKGAPSAAAQYQLLSTQSLSPMAAAGAANNYARRNLFSRRYYRNDCTFRPGVGYIKDLSRFFPKDEQLKHVVILDNSPVSYALHEDNAVMIEGWINDQSDRDLLNLLPMLHSLSLCIDVRFILGLRSGEKVFEKY